MLRRYSQHTRLFTTSQSLAIKFKVLPHKKVTYLKLKIPFILTVDNRLFVNVNANFVERNGKKYLQLMEKPKIDLKTKRLYIQLDNLFNGNKQLGDTMNGFMNENWQELFNELKPSILDALGAVIVNLVNGVFIRIPYEQLFVDQAA